MSARAVLALALVAGLAFAAPASADPFIYYGSNNGSGVWRADIDGSSPTNIVTGGEFAASMAVDENHIYFKSLSTAISRADIDGTNLDSDFITLPSNASTIKEIEVNATHVYWTDDFNNAIGRARIAGPCTVGAAPPCDIEPAWIGAGSTGTGDGGVSGLAIDGTHIYWTRVVAGTIARANLDGSSRDTSFITGINTVGLDQAPFDVDVNGTHIYWSDSPDEVIGRAELNGSGAPTNLERAYVSTSPTDITAVEANATHVFWASDGGTIGRARTAGTCSTGVPPCDTDPSFIGGGNQLRALELGVVPVDVVVTDCDDPELAGLTRVTGDLIVHNVPGCDAVSFPNLTEVGGDVVIDGNPDLDAIDLGSLTLVSGDLTTTDNAEADVIDLAALTQVSGDLTISGNPELDAIDLAAGTQVSGDLTITDNTGATAMDLGPMGTIGGDVSIERNTSVAIIDASSVNTIGGIVTIEDNTNANIIDASSLVSASASIDIHDNASDTVVDIGALADVIGHLDVDTAGTSVDLTGVDVDGDLTVTANGSNSVAATTAGGVTDVEVLGGTATMHVVLPDGAFLQPVSFTIERQGNGPPETGTTATGAAADVDPVAGYRFAFATISPTLAHDAQLAFTVDLAQLGAATRTALLAGIADQTATLVVRADGSGALYRALSRCTGAQTPAADGCVKVVLLGADGQPAAAGSAPAFARFDAVASHFSTYAVALAKPVPPATSTPPATTPAPTSTVTPGPTMGPKPSNAFRLTKLTRNRRKGTATLTAVLPGRGALVLKGKGIRRVRRTVASRTGGSVTVKLAVRVTGAAKRKLKRNGRLRVKAKVVYTPAGGDPRTRTKRITLVRSGARSAR